jgi:hypothetical protein
MVLVLTTAVSDPAEVGFVENVTTIEFAVALVTVPTAPLLKVTTLLASTVSKPKPAIVTVAESAARLVVALVTTGRTDATWTALPLPKVFEVTTAVTLPAAVGPVVNVTVKAVAVALATVPTAPLVRTTVLFAAVGSNPKPLMISVVASAAKLVVLLVTTGVIVAICVALPATPLVVTVAVSAPADVGRVEKVTVNEVEVAEVTEPTAPLSKVTVLFPTTVLKPKPLMITVFELAPLFVVLAVTTGATVAT